MPQAGAMISRYVEAAQACGSIDELEQLSSAALGYVNRLHMWVDQVFPWGVCDGFKRPDATTASVA
jgi:hypothetical protein